ncbi:MAG: hypothetical protein KA072_01120 [Thermoanaerobaculaceae bacterium]|nr:hypothetical protein [Thermoanaerobaculaceae bacterium]MDI9622410.1 hypothetical protein [Acidobacteriota bacterium]NLH11165.1 hypothetical protein [Holophagae bacterium]HPW54311.1 hypothetical protein [Thermoanaerobaculaceae bacterium]
MVRRFERGEGKIGCVIGLILLAIAIWIGVKAIPVRVSVGALQDFVVQTAERASLLRDTPGGDSKEKQIIWLITQKAEQERLPVQPDNIEVALSSQRCIIRVKYTVPIDFGFYTYNWAVVHEADRVLF